MQLEALMTCFSHYHYDLPITVLYLSVEIQFLYFVHVSFQGTSERLKQDPEQHFPLPPHVKRGLLDSTQ